MSNQSATTAITESRRRMLARRRRTVAALIVFVLLVAAGYFAAVALTPLPEPEVTVEVPAEETFETDHSLAQSLVDSQTLPTAVGWAHNDAVWSNDDGVYPIASITKLVTLLVGLEAHPLAEGEDGPTYTWSFADQQIMYDYLAVNGIVKPIQVGTELTMREMITLMMLPSSNEYATVYANWVFGSTDAFVAAANEFAATNGLTSLRIVEPSGLDSDNVATAADLVRLAKIAVQNETVLEFTSLQSAVAPGGIGLITNTNPLVGVMPGVIGLKTGSLTVIGYNLAAAQRIDALGREVISLSVTLARDSILARAASGSEMLEQLATMPAEHTLVTTGELIASVTTIWGESTELITTGDAAAVLLPGELAARAVVVEVGGSTIESHTEAGTVTVTTPVGAQHIDVVTTDAITEPDLWWRLTHPAIVFGWE